MSKKGERFLRKFVAFSQYLNFNKGPNLTLLSYYYFLSVYNFLLMF